MTQLIEFSEDKFQISHERICIVDMKCVCDESTRFTSFDKAFPLEIKDRSSFKKENPLLYYTVIIAISLCIFILNGAVDQPPV